MLVENEAPAQGKQNYTRLILRSAVNVIFASPIIV
jgi:hypothetical protein